MPWSRPFDDPIQNHRKTIRTLNDAAEYIKKLSKAEQESPHWEAAIEALIMAAEDRGPLMHAYVGMLRALNHDQTAPQRQRRQAKAYRII